MASPAKAFVTYDALAARLAGADGRGGGIELAHNEFLTPAAMDLAEQRQLAVHRQAAPVPVAPDRVVASPRVAGDPGVRRPQAATGEINRDAYSTTGATIASASVGLVVHQADPKTRALVDSLYRDGLPLADFNVDGSWMTNLRAMCGAIAAGRLAGGLAVLPLAAEGMVLANKVAGIRAVQGTTLSAVRSAVRRLAANVLVLDHSASTFHELRAMALGFARERGPSDRADALLVAVEQLEKGTV